MLYRVGEVLVILGAAGLFWVFTDSVLAVSWPHKVLVVIGTAFVLLTRFTKGSQDE